MKRIAFLALPALLLAQTTPFQDATTALGKMQTQIDAAQTTIVNLQSDNLKLQAKLTDLQTNNLAAQIDAKCAGCSDFIKTNFINVGTLDGVMIICCGPATVPSTPPNSQMLYFYTTPKTTAVGGKLTP